MKNLLNLFPMALACFSFSANADLIPHQGSAQSPTDTLAVSGRLAGYYLPDGTPRITYTCAPHAAPADNSGEHPSAVSATTEKEGQLAEILGDDLLHIDSLSVSGPINETDINTIWKASFHGKLKVLDMKDAIIPDLPEDAFFKADEQLDYENGIVYAIWLESITLPETLRKIGESAFSYAIFLSDINFNNSLKEIGNYAFNTCKSLKTDPLILPEGLEKIGSFAFIDCYNLKGEIVLPQSIRILDDFAFFSVDMTKINFPEGLEAIGNSAFYGSRLKEAILPETCLDITGQDHFALNYELKKIHLPEGLTEIPAGFADGCIVLSEINIPSSVTSIGKEAFMSNNSLPDVQLPEGIRTIGESAFEYCNTFDTIFFPSSTEYIGSKAFAGCHNVRKIFCAAIVPPTCGSDSKSPGTTPFDDITESIEIYVPIGSANAYMNAPGWNYFHNFVETDKFPSSGIETVTDQSVNSGNPTTYNLQGIKIENPQKGQLYIRDGKLTNH